MSGKIDIRTEILSDSQLNTLHQLSKALIDADYYLAGGTALALRISHRLSEDFDWFVSRLGNPEELFKKLRLNNISFSVISTAVETIYINIDSVQVSFIGYDYPLLESSGVTSSKFPFRIAGLDDIACMKLAAIGSRGSRKDFVDLHFLITEFRSLEEYLELYTKKFENRDIGHVIRSLVYFKDAESEPELKIIKPFDWNKMKADFEDWVKDLNI